MKTIHHLSLYSILLSATALAGTAEMDSKTIVPVPAAKNSVEFHFRTTVDYVGSGDFRFKSAGDQDAFHASAVIGFSIPQNQSIYYTLDGFYDRYDFGTSLAPVPTTLTKIGADIAIEYRAEGDVAFALIASPGFYGSEVDTDSFNVPITAYGSYRLSPNLVLVAGVRYNEWSMYQLLPSGGLIWTVNDRWKVRGIVTAPKVEYTPNQNITFSVGGELTGGTYVTSKNEQNFPDKHLDYYDIRAGAGVTYRGWKPLDVNLSAGWSFERNFRYDDIDVEYRVKGAPYIALSARAIF